MPCDVIGLTMEDQMGNSVDDVDGDLKKHRLDENGVELSVETFQEKNDGRQVIAERVEKELTEKQGCRISGFVEALRVPGILMISHTAFEDIELYLQLMGYTLDNSFQINHLSFGSMADFEAISRSFPDAGVMHPLDGFKRTIPSDQSNMRVGFYLKAVPAIFLGEFGSLLNRVFSSANLFHRNEVFQLTASSETEF